MRSQISNGLEADGHGLPAPGIVSLHGPRPDLPALTGLRGIAALWVFAYHVYKSFAGDGAGIFANDAIPILREGWRGVDLFFVLSGFVIAYVHLKDFDRLSAPRIRSYALRRFWRVYPLNAFWHTMVVALFLVAPAVLTIQPRYNPASISPKAFIAGVLLVQTWFPGYTSAWNWPSWSLSAEIAAYMLFPFLAVCANRVRQPAQGWVLAAFAIAGLAMLLQLQGKLGVNAAANYNGILRAVCCFSAGVAMYRALSLAPLTPRKADGLATAGLIFALLGCMGSPWNYLWVPAAALLIAAASNQGSTAGRLLSNRVVLKLGEVSFSLYLSHWPIVLVLRAELVQRGTSADVGFIVGAVVATVAVTAIVTYLSWRYVEAPMHRYGRRADKQRSTAAA